MASAPRDRVIIDLRGIGDAVRSAAAQRRVTVARLARQALLATVGGLPGGAWAWLLVHTQ